MRKLLEVVGVSKSYPTYASDLHRFATWFGAPVRPTRAFEAVHNVTFTVADGETVAIIGQNGAGKSTLLKMITGTVRPSSGRIEVGGKISAILELGLGFNPEFTGRENVRHSGGLLGLSSELVEAAMPDIEAFTELGAFLDQPLRTYSSGMVARLAFGLATAGRPELLIVDEVLSVGDAYFAHKSFARIRKFRDEGTAILFVTHSMSDVRELCDRVILLEGGRVIRDGAPDEVCDFYNAMIAAKEKDQLTIEQRRQEDGWLLSRSGTGQARISAFDLQDAGSGKPVKTAKVGQRLRAIFDVEVLKEIPALVIGVMLRDRTGHVVFGTNTWHTGQRLPKQPGGTRVRFEFVFEATLGPGSYSLSPALVSTDTHLVDNYEWLDNLIVFDVINYDRSMFIGSSLLDCEFMVDLDRT